MSFDFLTFQSSLFTFHSPLFTPHSSNEPLMMEEQPAHARNAHREYDSKEESPRLGLHAIDEVHTKHGGDERGYHHNNGDRGERTHHGVHIIVDDTLVGVHRGFQNV